MALSTDTPIKFDGLDTERFIQGAVTSYWGSLMAGLHATGHTKVANDTADSFFLGIDQSGQLGDAANEYLVSTGGGYKRNATVAGYTSAAFNFKLVYCASDDIADLTLTRPADDAFPVGITMKYQSSGKGDVRFFSMMESMLFGLSGRGKETLCLGTHPCSNTTGDVLTGYTLWGHGKITGFFIISDGDGAGAGADVDLNLELGGTNVTASQISMLLATQQTQGAKTATDAAISGANEFSDGDLLDIEAVENTAFTAGTFTAFIEVERMV